ncbi:MAG: DUF983 domain-containing protein [Acidimicrobiales bacterium]|nr:DUF983 domain-containing protein [Acidimicrobiales bacterium]
MDAPPPLTPRRVVTRGLLRRCPMCGHRGMFRGWFELRDRCPTCNYPTTRVGDQWIGALGMNMIVTFTVLAVALAVGFIVTYPDPPIAVLMVTMITIAAVVPIAFYPISKSLWSGIDLAMRPPEPDDDIDPRFLPPTGR